jgi:hypothetical protein
VFVTTLVTLELDEHGLLFRSMMAAVGGGRTTQNLLERNLVASERRVMP